MNNKLDVLIAIHPEHCFDIFKGNKTKELRKTFPSLEPPFRVHVYCTKGSNHLARGDSIGLFRCYNWKTAVISGELCKGNVIGSFVCDGYEKLYATPDCERIIDELCITNESIKEYLNGGEGYAWNIVEPKLYDKPKELGEFRKPCELFKKNVCGLRTLCGEQKGVCDGTRKLTRPPQSWCYVREL